jgi:hypothetical protein
VGSRNKVRHRSTFNSNPPYSPPPPVQPSLPRTPFSPPSTTTPHLRPSLRGAEHPPPPSVQSETSTTSVAVVMRMHRLRRCGHFPSGPPSRFTPGESPGGFEDPNRRSWIGSKPLIHIHCLLSIGIIPPSNTPSSYPWNPRSRFHRALCIGYLRRICS